MPTIDASLIESLEKIEEPGLLLADLHRQFGGRMAIGTSGQLTGCALVDMAVQAGFTPRVFTNDTLRLFPETYDLFLALEKRYHLKIERFAPPAKELARMLEQHGEYLFFDSKERQEYCCYVRKVLPNNAALQTLDVWITGLRADQSQSRAGVKRFEMIPRPSPSPLPTGESGRTPGEGEAPSSILKVAPLAGWTEAQVRDYLVKYDVPVHALLNAKFPGGFYYESLGCILCTTPIGPNEPRRAGRWRWFNTSDDKKECGLHLPQPPQP
jgi:phosphoadenosine phosphosulfate reductase